MAYALDIYYITNLCIAKGILSWIEKACLLVMCVEKLRWVARFEALFVGAI